MNRARLIAIAAITAACLFASTADAATVLQQTTLTAKGNAQTWESTDRGGNVYVHVALDGIEVEQHYVNRCRASYVDRDLGLYVWVRIKNCGVASATDLQPFVIRYLSTSGHQQFSVRLTTSPEDGVF